MFGGLAVYTSQAVEAFSPADRAALLDDGFLVIPGPIPEDGLRDVITAYDAAIASADPADLAMGRTTTRVNDFVNRGPEFDSLYVYPPMLAACDLVINDSFRLSALLGRTVRANVPAQDLHVDFAADADGWPMLGFIFMIDEFRPDNGATRFLAGSHLWSVDATERDTRREACACAPAGSMILYNGSVWHGHGANSSSSPRRSIQGSFIRRGLTPGTNFRERLRSDTGARLTAVARHLLDV